MTLSIGRNRNTNDIATRDTVTLNETTATTIAPANPDRIFFSARLELGSTKGCWIRLQPASEDATGKHDIFITRSPQASLPFIMEVDNVYTGEISAILESGSNADIMILEY